MLRVAASSSRTTRSPSRPSLSGSAPSRMHSAKCANDRLQRLAGLDVRAPDVAGAVADEQPAALVDRVASGPSGHEVDPAVVDLDRLDGLSSLKIRLFRDPAKIICRTFTGDSQLTWKLAISRSP